MKIVAIHGAFHGAWCWEPLQPELERLGHQLVAVDLPISDPTAAGERYAETVAEQIGHGEPPVLLAHSMAGLVAPLVAARTPVRRMVFLAAFLPVPGMSANEQRAREPIDPPVAPATVEWTDLGDDVWRVGPGTAAEMFFHDVPAPLQDWAVAHLRPQCYRVLSEPSPFAAWPDVPTSYVVCRDDHAINAEWGRTAARDRLGIEPVEIEGGHSPFLSRPAELAALIDTAIDGTGSG
jgi:pimeloyl-ACP methyl ester carboxylesterase